MKATNWLILLLLVFCRCTNPAEVEPKLEYPILDVACLHPIVHDRYIYPIVPGMTEWQTANSMSKLYDFCQLPNDILKSISTRALIDALIRAPLFSVGDFSSMSPVAGWQNHYRKFNSALELFQRENAGNELANYYRFIDFGCTINNKIIDGIEMLFTKQEILDKMDHDLKRSAVNFILARSESYPDYKHSLSPLVYLMYADGYEPIVQYSQENPENFNDLLMGTMNYQQDLIFSYAKNYINDGNPDPLVIYTCSPEVNDRYIYPIVPGMPEWQQLGSMDAAYEACQLPDDVLKSISTSGLVDALVHVPLFTVPNFTSISPIIAWQNHFNRFNSALELFQREDAGDVLVNYYKLIDFDCLVVASLDISFRTRFSLNGIEMLFTRQEILDTMGHEKKKEVVATILAIHEQYYSDPRNTLHLFPIVYLLYADEYEPIVQYSQDNPENFNYLLEGTMNYQQNLVVSYAKNYINDKN